MKKLLNTVVLSMAGFLAMAQTQSVYEVSADVHRDLDKITVTYYMVKVSGEDLELGHTGFTLAVENGIENPVLNLNKVKVDRSQVIRWENNASYEDASAGFNPELASFTYTVYKRLYGAEKGQKVTEVPTRLGSVTIPVSNPEEVIKLDWNLNGSDVTDYQYEPVAASKIIYKPIPPIHPVRMSNELNGIRLSEVYPNPAKTDATLILNSKKDAQLSIEVKDMFGKVMMAQTADITVGYNQVKLDVAQLAYGNYMVIISEARESISYKLIKQ